MRRAGWGRTTVLLVGTLLVGCDALFPYQARVDHRTDRARIDGPVRVDLRPAVDTALQEGGVADLRRGDAWVDQRPAADLEPADLRPAVDLAPKVDFVPAPDFKPKVDLAPAPDLKPNVDLAPTPDLKANVDQQIATPQIVITEIMVNEGGGIPEGEWFELYNQGPQVDLQGWTLKDNYGTHTINASLVIQQSQYLVLKAKAAKVGGNLYEYSDTSGCSSVANICFNNDADKLQIYDAMGKLVDEVVYDAPSWPYSDMHSMSLKSPTLDNSKAANWCNEATKKYAQQNYGTPGEAAGCP